MAGRRKLSRGWRINEIRNLRLQPRRDVFEVWTALPRGRFAQTNENNALQKII